MRENNLPADFLKWVESRGLEGSEWQDKSNSTIATYDATADTWQIGEITLRPLPPENGTPWYYVGLYSHELDIYYWLDSRVGAALKPI